MDICGAFDVIEQRFCISVSFIFSRKNHSFRLGASFLNHSFRLGALFFNHLSVCISCVRLRHFFLVRGIIVRSRASGVFQQRVCIFVFRWTITHNRFTCAAPVSGGMECARKIRFSARIFAIFIMSWSRPIHYSFVLLFQSLCSLRCTPVRDHGIRIRRSCMHTRVIFLK